jgi:hypothetical protein
LPSTFRLANRPNDDELTFAGVNIVSARFWPVREVSLCQVKTPTGPVAADTVIGIVVLELRDPLVPLTVSRYDPAATSAFRRIVAWDEPAVGLAANLPSIPAGQFTAASVTAPLKPFAEITVTVEVPLAPPAVAVAGVALNVKLGGAFTVSAIAVVALSDPLLPVTVSEYGPGVTPDPTLTVTSEDPVAGLVPNTAVIPTGQLTAASVTPALKPFAAVTDTVEVPFVPAVAVAAVALNVKLGGGALTVSAITAVVLSDPLVPVTVSE